MKRTLTAVTAAAVMGGGAVAVTPATVGAAVPCEFTYDINEFNDITLPIKANVSCTDRPPYVYARIVVRNNGAIVRSVTTRLRGAQVPNPANMTFETSVPCGPTYDVSITLNVTSANGIEQSTYNFQHRCLYGEQP